MDNSKNTHTVLSLCTGYGGIERGIKRTGFDFRTICYVEWEAFAIANLVAKMEANEMDSAPIWSNLKTLPLEPFRGKVSVLLGGYPCQPFSTTGKRRGKDDPRHLWPHISRIIKTVKPLRVFFENVEGHITKGLRDVIEDLGGMGYSTTWGIFSAGEVGASHQRKRLFIMADSDNCGGRENFLPTESRSSGPVKQPGHTRYLHQTQTEQVQKWPAGPTEVQHDWEKPRVVESRVGGTTNGVRNRNHRLRLLGNGVVPATAELAWNTLSKNMAQFQDF